MFHGQEGVLVQTGAVLILDGNSVCSVYKCLFHFHQD